MESLLAKARNDPEILAVLLFGSAARQEETLASDLDVCLVLLPSFRSYSLQFAICILISSLTVAACAPRVVQIQPKEGAPGTVVSLSMEYLVGWPRVEMGGHMMDFYQMKLLAKDPERAQVPGEELIWIEDKILQFRVPPLRPGNYTITIYDDKGPPGDKVYSFLETTAYLVFPPVWPFVLRSNETTASFRVLPSGEP